MRKLLFLFLFGCLQPIMADDYKIMQMNTSSVRIGNVQCKQGDTFSDEDQIVWSSDKQAMKAMNLRTKQIKLFAAKVFSNIKAKSVKDYYLKNNHLSTRGSLVTFSDLAEELSDTIDLYDVVEIESPVKNDSLSSYLISYELNGERKWRALMSTDSYFYLCRELFNGVDDQTEYTLTLYFRKKGMEDYMISDEIVVRLLPLEINNDN